MNSLPDIQQLLIDEFGLTKEQVVADALLENLGIDSLATIEFMFVLEERFKLEMPSNPGPIKTVADIAREVDRMLDAARGVSGQTS